MSKLVIEAVGKIFPAQRGGEPTRALMPTSLTVADNDFITILGPSGCGKSTLLKMVAGLLPVTSGELRFGGAPIEGPPDGIGSGSALLRP